MFGKLIFIIPPLTILFFAINIFFKGNTVSSVLLFVLSFLPLMDIKITPEAWGGFKTFDFICFYSLIFLLREFITFKVPLRYGYYIALFILFFILIVLGGLASEFPKNTYLGFVKVLPIFIFARFFISECSKDPGFFNKAIKALKISYIAALLFLGVQIVVGLKFTFYPGLAPNTDDPVYHVIRYPGIFYDSQAHGQFLAMGSFLFMYIPRGTSRRNTVIQYIIFAVSIAAIILAGSRAALGGFAVGLVIVFLMAASKYRIYGLVIAITAFAAYLIFSPTSGVFERAGSISEDYLFRQNIWKEAFDISKKHPGLGIGIGNYQEYVIRHAQDQYLEIEDGELVYFDQPENGYLKIMVELGFTGFALFVLFVLSPLLTGFVRYLQSIYDKRITFFIASLISFLIAFNTVYSIYDYRLLIMVACMIVLILSYPITQKRYEPV